MGLNLTMEQVEFLKGHRFYYVVSEEYPYVYGHIKCQRHQMEIYNDNSVSKLIEELKNYGEALTSVNSVLFSQLKEELYSVDCFGIDRISMKKDRKTGEMRVTEPIKSFFNARYTRLIVNETVDYITFISRYNGDMGDGSQYVEQAYRSREVAMRVAIEVINRRKEELNEQSDLLDILLREYGEK